MRPGSPRLAPNAVPTLRHYRGRGGRRQADGRKKQLWRRLSAPALPVAPKRPRVSRLAIASLITALAGIPLFGVLTGLVAVVLGAMAVGGIRGGSQHGVAWAATGLLLGLVDVVGWAVFLTMFFTGAMPTVRMQDMQPDLSSFKDLDPKIGRAMRSNVLIEGRAGMGIHLGSGVILRIKDGWADVLTNRHVADPDFAADPEGVRAGAAGGHLTVQLVGQDAREGTVELDRARRRRSGDPARFLFDRRGPLRRLETAFHSQSGRSGIRHRQSTGPGLDSHPGDYFTIPRRNRGCRGCASSKCRPQ